MTIPPSGPEQTSPPSARRAFGAAAAAIVVVHLLASTLLTPGYIVPDSLGTYAWLRSFVWSGDFLLLDEWAGFRLVRGGITLFKEIARTGALANHWGVGASLLSAPAYLAAHAASGTRPDANGFSGLYALSLGWTAVLFGIASSLAALAALRDTGVRERAAVAAILLTLAGTPMLWYEVRFPLGTHLAGLFCVAMLVLALARLAPRSSLGDVLAGALLGLAIVTRIQHVMLAPAVALHLARSGDPTRRLLRAGLGATVPLAIQAVAWSAIYGHPFGPLVSGSAPLGGTWMAFGANALGDTLLSSYHGLLPWAPIVALGIAGWILQLQRERLAATLLLMFTAEWIANGLFDRYFWGGMGFGPRRFVDLAVPVMIGVGWLLRRARAAGWIAAGVAAAWSALLFLAAASRTLDLAGDVRGADLVAAVVSIPWDAVPGALWGGAALVRAPALFFGGAAIAALVGGLGAMIAGSRARAAIALALLLAAGLGASLAAFGPTRSGARRELARHRINVPAARVAGPLLDARVLFLDELEFRRNRGRVEEARETEALVGNIDRALAEVGVTP